MTFVFVGGEQWYWGGIGVDIDYIDPLSFYHRRRLGHHHNDVAAAAAAVEDEY